jgi:hypothetical protein
MGNEHSYCRKEREIGEIHTDLKNIKRIVMGDGSKEGLDVCVPKISQELETLNEKTIPDLKTGISGFLRFQKLQEGKQEGKDLMRKRTQWVIGTLVGITMSLLGLLIALILKM